MKKTKKAFTLAEIMIVLTVIGVLTAIIMPAAFHSAPNEDIMKFKKANNNLATIVRELVSNEKYYKEGDLRSTPSDATPGNNYMCQAIADLVAAKDIDCSNNDKTAVVYIEPITSSSSTQTACGAETKCNLANGKAKLDDICDDVASPKGITTSDGVIWYEANQAGTLEDPNCTSAPDCNNVYKVLCLKIGTKYFGYGVRSDGKVIPGANADTYMDKSLQDDD